MGLGQCESVGLELGSVGMTLDPMFTLAGLECASWSSFNVDVQLGESGELGPWEAYLYCLSIRPTTFVHDSHCV